MDWTGIHNPNSVYYLFWSGIGGDLLTAIPLIVAVALWYRHNKCHNCYRLGHHVPNVHYPVCKKHKPVLVQPRPKDEPYQFKADNVLDDGSWLVSNTASEYVERNIKQNDDGTISAVDPNKPSSFTN